MHIQLRHLAVIAAFLLPATAAHAQYYGSAPQSPQLYPYAAPSEQPYAVQVSPNQYVIQRNPPARVYPYVQPRRTYAPASEKNAKRFDRPHKPVNHELVEELRKRAEARREKSDEAQENGEQGNRSVKIVRDKPVVVTTKRYVDDPPRVIERNIVVDDETTRAPRQRGLIQTPAAGENVRRDDNKKRVIQADAEVTILGPDRMSIRLFRKGQGPKANDD
jgi:hypothetical protein